MVLEKTLENPLDCKEIQPVHPKGNHAEAEATYFGHLMQRANSVEKILMLGKLRAGGEGDDRGWLDGITDLMDMSSSNFWEIVKDRKA